MRYKTEQDFSKAIRDGAQGLILLCGNEDFLIQNWRRQVLKEFGGEEGFNLQHLDGSQPDLDALYDATQMLPLFADKKCVYWSDVDPGKLDDLVKLEEIFQQLPPECVLLITARAPAFDASKGASKKLVTLSDQYGAVLELDGRDTSSMVRFLQQQAKAGGASLSTKQSRYLLSICENDMQTLAGEVAKVAAYAAGQEITQEHIDAVVSPKTEAKVFDLSREITDGNAQRAMEILQDLFYLQEHPIGITATLIMSYTDIYRAHVAKNEGKSVQDVTEAFAYGRMVFRVRNAFRVNMTTQALRLSLKLLYECETQLKGSSLDDQLVLEKTVLGLLACREG